MKLTLIALFVFILFSAFSQNSEIGFKGGISAGIIMAQVDGDNYSGYNRLGPQLGVFSKYIFNDDFSLHTELKYIQKGSRHVYRDKSGTVDYFEFKLDYFEVPILLEYKIIEKFYAQAGLGIGYLFNSKVDPDGNGFYDPPDPFKSYEISGIAGVYYYLNSHIYVGAIASYSILPVLSHPGNQIYLNELDFGCHNNIVGASINYLF